MSKFGIWHKWEKRFIDIPEFLKDLEIRGKVFRLDVLFKGDLNDIEIRKIESKPITEPVFSENYPVTFDDKGMRAFIQDNFEEHFKGITLTDEELDQFKRYLEASLSDWISENWRDFMANRGD